ncbi:MAG: hypothetical protein R3190_10690, partial [Thermoanaerobaculia bacterium]|nr:hypothetical protein [Thermoanaerobaculia bacterium]
MQREAMPDFELEEVAIADLQRRMEAGELTARRITEVFTEVVIAPGFDEAALAVLQEKKNLRILRMPHADRPTGGWDLRSVAGGLLVQTSDVGGEPTDDWRVATEAEPTEDQLADLRF